MRKRTFKKLRTLAACLFTAALIYSCQEEKPIVDIGGDDYKIYSFETAHDTLVIDNEGLTNISFSNKYIPYDLATEQNVKISLTDTAGVAYKYASIQSVTEKDDIWHLSVKMLQGYKSGDIVQLIISVPGKSYQSQFIVLFQPIPQLSFSLNITDELVIKERETAQLFIRTNPWNLIERDSAEVFFVDTLNARYNMNITEPVLQKDSTWMVYVGLKMGAKTGDIIKFAIKDKVRDTILYSKPLYVRQILNEVPTEKEIHRVSGDVSAFEAGGMATVRFCTTPWNLLLDADSIYINITDTLGVNTELFNVSDMELHEDSTWTIKVNISNTSSKKEFGTIRMTTPDSVYLSENFRIEEVTFDIDKIRVLNYTYGPKDDVSSMDYDAATKTFSCVMPGITDFSNQNISVLHNGDKLTVGDSLIEDCTTLSFNTPVTITLWKYDISKDYTVYMRNTGLPIVRINTPDKKSIARFDWMELCHIEVVYPDGTIYYESDSLSIRGRGNAWTESDKKPYALKLNHKHKMLGMHKHKRWVLLANYKDYTLLRNDASLWLSKKTSLPYTVSGQYVELVLNGEHRGNYYLCEQIKIDDNRLNIDKPNLTNPSEGGYLMAIDTYWQYNNGNVINNDPGFRSTYYSLPYIFKDPDELEDESPITSSHPAFIYLQDKVNEMEACLNDEQRVKNHEYRNYIDVRTAIDFALVQEMTMNHDSYNTWPSNGPHSTYLYMDKTHTDGKFCFGPLWDFDYHTFMPECYENGYDLAKEWAMLKIGAKTSSGRYYFDSLLQDPDFKDSLVARWDELKYEFAKLPDYIDMMVDSISESERCNRILWFDQTYNSQNGDRGPFENAISRMKDGFWKRWDWIDENIRKL